MLWVELAGRLFTFPYNILRGYLVAWRDNTPVYIYLADTGGTRGTGVQSLLSCATLGWWGACLKECRLDSNDVVSGSCFSIPTLQRANIGDGVSNTGVVSLVGDKGAEWFATARPHPGTGKKVEVEVEGGLMVELSRRELQSFRARSLKRSDHRSTPVGYPLFLNQTLRSWCSIWQFVHRYDTEITILKH